MKKAQLFVLVAIVVLWPSSAFAARSFWGWLEELSGPGPFRGYDIPVTLLCNYGSGLKPCWELPQETTGREASRPIKASLVLKFGRYTSDPNEPRFQDLPATDPDNLGKVSIVPVTALYMFRRGALDFGPGIGFWRISGEGFGTFYKFVVTPMAASFSPLALRPRWKNEQWARFLRLEIDTTFVPQGFDGSEFNNSRTTFKVEREFLTRAAVVIDAGALISRWR